MAKKGRSAKNGSPAGQQVKRSGLGFVVQWQHEKALASWSGLEVPDELTGRAAEEAHGLAEYQLFSARFDRHRHQRPLPRDVEQLASVVAPSRLGPPAT